MTDPLLIPDKIIKSKRKSISIQINLHGEMIVRAPLKMTLTEITKFINEKEIWIKQKRQECLNHAIKSLSFNGEESISILGETYVINYENVSKPKIKGNQVVLNKLSAKQQMIKLLKTMAKKYLSERVQELAGQYGFVFQAISISSAKTNWGSCSFNNRIHFTYKLMLCPKEVVDYIIIHELCHTKVKNHSHQFWEMVSNCCHNYEVYEKWLKTNRGLVETI